MANNLANSFVGETKVKLGSRELLLRPTNDALARWESVCDRSFLGLASKVASFSAKYGRMLSLDFVKIREMSTFFLVCAEAAGEEDLSEKAILDLIQQAGLAHAAGAYLEAVLRSIAVPGVAAADSDEGDDGEEDLGKVVGQKSTTETSGLDN